MNLFDILGPVMVGPSSSHTAGAVRIGQIARQLLGGEPKTAKIWLHGSFAETGRGHGTDRALVAGLLGMPPDDPRIPDSFAVAAEQGLDFEIGCRELRGAHPNSAELELDDGAGHTLDVQAASLGGGRVRVDRLNGMEVSFSGENDTLIIRHADRQGIVADISSLLSISQINIATMQLFREKRGGSAVMVVEMDAPLDEDVKRLLRRLQGVKKVAYLQVRR